MIKEDWRLRRKKGTAIKREGIVKPQVFVAKAEFWGRAVSGDTWYATYVL